MVIWDLLKVISLGLLLFFCFSFTAFGGGDTSVPNYCQKYNLKELPSEIPIHNYCTDNQEYQIYKSDIDKLSGFVKKGSSTSLHYLRTTGSPVFKKAIRKIVITKLLEKRNEYLGLYENTSSEFTNINKCVKDNGIDESILKKENISTKDKRDFYGRAYTRAALMLRGYLSYYHSVNKELKSIDDLISKISYHPKNSIQDSPKKRLENSMEVVDSFIANAKDDLVKDVAIAYKNTLSNANCKEVVRFKTRRDHHNEKHSRKGQNTFRGNNGKSIKVKKYKCYSASGALIDGKFVDALKEGFLNQKIAPMISLAKSYPMLVSPENHFFLFKENKTIRPSALMGKIIGDIGVNRASKRSKFFKSYLSEIQDKLKNGNEKDLDTLNSTPEFQNNLNQLMSNSAFTAIFDREDEKYLNDNKDTSYMKPATQEYIDKLDDSIMRFCEDDDLEFDYHNQKQLADHVLNKPRIIANEMGISEKEAVITSHIAYCSLLQKEPLATKSISGASVVGFGLLLAGSAVAVTPVIGARVAAMKMITTAGAILTAGSYLEYRESLSFLEQQEGYVAIGAGDLLKLHNLQSEHNLSATLLPMEMGLLVFNVATIKKLAKIKTRKGKTAEVYTLDKAEKIDPNDLSNLDVQVFKDGEFNNDISRLLLGANSSEQATIKRSVEAAMSSQRKADRDELAIFLEYAVGRENSEAVSLLNNTSEFMSKYRGRSPAQNYTAQELRAKKALDKYHTLKTKSPHAYKEQSEWLKCNSKKYKTKRNQGTTEFVRAIPNIRLGSIPVSAVISNWMKGEDAKWDINFMKMVVGEVVFTQTFSKALSRHVMIPAISKAKTLNGKAKSVAVELGTHFASGSLSGYVKGTMFDMIEKLPIGKKNEVYKIFYSDEFQKFLKGAEADMANLDGIDRKAFFQNLGLDDEEAVEYLQEQTLKMLKDIAASDKNIPTREGLTSAETMALADSTFALANAYKLVVLSDYLSPYYCMSYSNSIPDAVKAKYRLKGTALYIAQSLATQVSYFQYRDFVFKNFAND